MGAAAPGMAQSELLSREAHFQIASQPLPLAILEFSDQARIQVISSGNEVANATTPGVTGRYRIVDALQAILQGTGLQYTVLNENTISIKPTLYQAVSDETSNAMALAAARVETNGSTARQRVREGVLEVVEVTATRIIRDGYEAPTPTTVMGPQALKVFAAANIADAVNALPAVAGSATPRNGNSGVSSGQSGTNTLDLRSMGANRTLVLLDGARVVAQSLTGVVDINQFPDGLIERVDVVTGGASAAYGSDAMTGVVNFVLDKGFTGFKTDVMGGVTGRGENEQYNVSATAGMPFAADRGHFLINGGYSEAQGIKGNPRSWYQGWKVLNNPAYAETNGQPQYLVRPHSAMSTSTPGALVTAGPLRGMQFGEGGAIRQFEFGPIISNPIMSGGDWLIADRSRTPDLEAQVMRQTLFTRASFELTDNLEVFAQASHAYSQTQNQCCWNYYLGNITLQRDNAFLPESVRTQMTALALDSLVVGSSNEDLGAISAYSERTVDRYVVGANGDFAAFGSGWSWKGYAQRGISKISNDVTSSITANYRNALDAVPDANGQIVCRSALANPGNGCVPYNVLGSGVNSQAAIDYVLGTAMLDQRLVQDVVAVSAQGEPFSTWAGPVSIASGMEYRKESVTSEVDPVAAANGYFVANFKATQGAYDVAEGFVETVVPLAARQSWAESLDLNAAVRWTDYSTSGEVTTWKLGATWSPIHDLTLRGTRSRDIRAPNLNDLFLAGQVNTQTVDDPFRGNATTSILRPQVGNLNLKPEEADTIGFGVVYQPSFVPGLSMSVDYYRIDVGAAIATIQQQAIIDRCFSGNTALCDAIVRDAAGVVTQVTVQPVNLLSEIAEGLDIEAIYRRPLWNGELTLRGLATHVLKRQIDDGITITELAGDNSGSAAHWRWLGMIGYDRGTYAVSLIGHGVSSGVLENSYIECTSACPASTVANRTIDNNQIKGAVYADLSFAYRLRELSDARKIEMFLKVDNVTDKGPAMVASIAGNSYVDPGVNPSLYDTVGRTFRAGARIQW